MISYQKSQHGCVRWALREICALHEHLTCNHAMISPAAGLGIVCDRFWYKTSFIAKFGHISDTKN